VAGWDPRSSLDTENNKYIINDMKIVQREVKIYYEMVQRLIHIFSYTSITAGPSITIILLHLLPCKAHFHQTSYVGQGLIVLDSLLYQTLFVIQMFKTHKKYNKQYNTCVDWLLWQNVH